MLCQLADSALYWAKRGGKRRTDASIPTTRPATWSQRQRAEIESLLAQERPIHPVFQPMVSLANGRIVGYEALAVPQAGRRTPDVWFAQAHGNGLGPGSRRWRSALEPLGRPFDAHLALNVSPSALSTAIVQRSLGGNLEDRGRDHRARVRPR